MADPLSPEDRADVHAFLSYAVVDDALDTLVGPEWQLSPSVTLKLTHLHFSNDHGTPLLDLVGRLGVGKASSIDIQGVATLSPLAARDGQFVTHLQIVALKPTVITGAFQLALHGLFGDLTRALTQQYLDKQPEIKLPVSQEFKVQVAGATTPLTFPTPEKDSSITGNLITPGFTLADGLAVQHAVLLEDGLHLFLSLESFAHAAAPADAEWAKLSNTDRLAALQNNKVSYSARINRAALNHLLQTISNLPPKARTALFYSTTAKGDLWSFYHANRGPAGIGVISATKANAQLDHPDSLKVEVQLSDLSLQPSPGAITGIKVKVSFNAQAQLKVWSNGGLPFGGGIGTSIGTDADGAVMAEGRLLATGSGDRPMLTSLLTSPDKANLTVELHLGQLGNKKINLSVGLPHTPLFSTPIPTGLENKMEVKVAGTKISRVVRLTDTHVDSSDRAIRISGNIKFLPSNSDP